MRPFQRPCGGQTGKNHAWDTGNIWGVNWTWSSYVTWEYSINCRAEACFKERERPRCTGSSGAFLWVISASPFFGGWPHTQAAYKLNSNKKFNPQPTVFAVLTDLHFFYFFSYDGSTFRMDKEIHVSAATRIDFFNGMGDGELLSQWFAKASLSSSRAFWRGWINWIQLLVERRSSEPWCMMHWHGSIHADGLWMTVWCSQLEMMGRTPWTEDSESSSNIPKRTSTRRFPPSLDIAMASF